MATVKLEKHVNLLNIARTTTSTSFTSTADRNPLWHYDAAAYDNVTAIYFEMVARAGNAADTAYMRLSTVGGTDVASSQVTTSVTASTNDWVRSADILADLVDGTTYRARWKADNGSGGAPAGTATFDAARIVIVQQGAVTKTETVIEIGDDNNVTTSYAVPTAYHIFLWEDARWDGTVAVYWEADLHCASGGSGNTCFSELYDITAGAAVASSEVTYEANTVLTRVRSSAITMVDGHTYMARVKGDTTGEDVAACKLVVQQTGTPTKTDCYMMVLNTATNGASTYTTFANQSRIINFSASNWDGDSEAFYYEATGNDGSGSWYYQLYNITDAAQLTEVTETSSTVKRIRSSAITMPSDDSNELDGGRANTSGQSATVFRSYLIAQMEWSPVGGGGATYPSWGWGINGW